jgi:hypothetical protein
MNFTNFIKDNGKRVNKEHFINLIQVAQIDGRMSQSELDLLDKQGKKFGLTDPEIDILKNQSLRIFMIRLTAFIISLISFIILQR